MKGKDSNCVGILSDKEEAATASNLSEFTIFFKLLFVQDPIFRFLSTLGDNCFIYFRQGH